MSTTEIALSTAKITVPTTEAWVEEFEALCSRLSTLFTSEMDENVRIRALRLAEKTVHQLHTPMTFAEAQTWAPLELFGAGVACEMGIFDVLSKHSGSLSTADIAKELNADLALVARIMRLLDAHYMVDQVSPGQYAANAITRDYVQPYRKGNVMTQSVSISSLLSISLLITMKPELL
jgi:hypothetical protein